MNTTNYNDQLQTIYRNIMFHQQNMAYANIMAAFSTGTPTTVPAPIIKVEPGLSDVSTTSTASPATSLIASSPPNLNRTQSPCSFSLDTEIPRDEIEGDIEVIMVRNLQDNLKKLDTTLNGLRGKKFGYRELLDISNRRPTYTASNSTTKRLRTSSFGSTIGSPHSVKTLNHVDEDRDVKKAKLNSTANSNVSMRDEHNESFESDDGRLMIDWNENDSDAKNETQAIEQIPIKKEMDMEVDEKHENDEDDYKPSTLRFERLKCIQKKKPRFNIENLDLTYHSNMARNFPGTENRTEEQQQRRDKNTLAARISRNKNKAYEKMLEQQSMDATVENLNLKRQIACLRVYANSLMKLSGFADTDFSKMWEANIKEMVYDSEA
ncbi:hypothetical protein ACKWTF_002018 [Chironomus riparius]